MGIPLTCNGTIFNNTESDLVLDEIVSDGDWQRKPAKTLPAGQSTSFEVSKRVNLDFSIIYKDDADTQIGASGSMNKGAQAHKFGCEVTPKRYECEVDPDKARVNPALVSWRVRTI